MNSVKIFLSQMTLLRWLTFLLGFLTVTLTDLLFWISFSFDASIILQWFPPIGKFWSCCCLSFHWFSIKLKTWCPISSHSFVIIWELFHGRISLNSVPLQLLVNFVSGFRLKLMHISLIVSIRSNLTYLHGCAAAIVHRNHFFCLYQQNKSSESKVMFR